MVVSIPSGVDPVTRQHLSAAEPKVGRRESKVCPTSAIAMDHLGSGLMHSTKKLSSFLDLALAKQGTNTSRTHGCPISFAKFNTAHRETKSIPRCFEECNVTLAVVSEAEVTPDKHLCAAELVDQEVLHKAGGALERSLSIEGKYEARVHSFGSKEFEALVKCGQQLWSSLGAKHCQRMGIEGDHYESSTPSVGCGSRLRQGALMATMDTIKDANGEHR